MEIKKLKKINVDDPVFALHEYGIDVDSLDIYLTGEQDYVVGTAADWPDEPGVEFVMANRFIKNLHLAMRNGKDKTGKLRWITVHMKSCGGDMREGMAIYDAIKACPNPIRIISYTHARSMTSIILQAATERLLFPHSIFMIHEGELALSGTNKQVKSYMAFGKYDDEIMMDIYAQRLKQKGKFKGTSIKIIKQYLQEQMDKKEDVWYTADEAIQMGFADKIYRRYK